MEFKACEHLSFDKSKIDSRIKIVECGDAVCWDRKDFIKDEPLPRFVQLCNKRGRLNGSTCCIEGNAECSLYSEKAFNVAVDGD